MLASIIGGGAALGVAVAGAISGIVSAHYQELSASKAVEYQHQTETAKIRSAMIMELLKFHDSKELTDNVKMMLKAGLLSDPDGKICKTILKGDC